VVTGPIEQEYFRAANKPGVIRLFIRHGVAASQFVQLITDICEAAEHLEPQGEAPECRDENDRMYLHCAVAAGVDYLVTRDLDLLDLRTVGTAPIITPPGIIEAEASAGTPLLP
jgi:predicted nucleic acid-binding protein